MKSKELSSDSNSLSIATPIQQDLGLYTYMYAMYKRAYSKRRARREDIVSYTYTLIICYLREEREGETL